jgi:hypothetical protein
MNESEDEEEGEEVGPEIGRYTPRLTCLNGEMMISHLVWGYRILFETNKKWGSGPQIQPEWVL